VCVCVCVCTYVCFVLQGEVAASGAAVGSVSDEEAADDDTAMSSGAESASPRASPAPRSSHVQAAARDALGPVMLAQPELLSLASGCNHVALARAAGMMFECRLFVAASADALKSEKLANDLYNIAVERFGDIKKASAAARPSGAAKAALRESAIIGGGVRQWNLLPMRGTHSPVAKLLDEHVPAAVQLCHVRDVNGTPMKQVVLAAKLLVAPPVIEEQLQEDITLSIAFGLQNLHIDLKDAWQARGYSVHLLYCTPADEHGRAQVDSAYYPQYAVSGYLPGLNTSFDDCAAHARMLPLFDRRLYGLLPMKAGDWLHFDGRMPHAGSANMSKAIRVVAFVLMGPEEEQGKELLDEEQYYEWECLENISQDKGELGRCYFKNRAFFPITRIPVDPIKWREEAWQCLVDAGLFDQYYEKECPLGADAALWRAETQAARKWRHKRPTD
jgi:hypothetical protein